MAFSRKSTSKCYLQFRKQQTSFLRLSPKVVNDHTVQLTPYLPVGEGQWDVKPIYMLLPSLKYSELTFCGWMSKVGK